MHWEGSLRISRPKDSFKEWTVFAGCNGTGRGFTCEYRLFLHYLSVIPSLLPCEFI